MVKVQVISSENIKPSFPTPQHLRTFKLSLLDQLIPAPYAPIVVFYPNNDGARHSDVQQRLVLLKESLSGTLTRFYPLAGVIQDELSINCNDQGAYFAFAEVKSLLSDFLNNLNLQSIQHFLPCENSFDGSAIGARVTNIQVNVFQCGGIAIGLCISHKIFDGAALSGFLKCWAATASGSGNAVYPDFIAPSIFPADDLWLRDTSMVVWGSLFKKGKCATRRLVFNPSSIATLKADASGLNLKYPTRVEVVSAFIWKCAMAATEKKCGSKRPSFLTHVVNLRKRIAPTLSDFSLGNLIWIASAKCKATCEQLRLDGLVNEVRRGIHKINGDFVKKMRGDNGPAVMSKSLQEIGNFGSKTGVDYYGFTSWCKMGFYEADFGWGKPVWASSVGLNSEVFMNLIILMDTKCGEGIEAWVTLDEQEMRILEQDLTLLSLASWDPSPTSD
ncbi:epi-neemfruitin B 7-O-acetyltransferse L7AT-like [Apium graveolens]|uniref:epi-neemfruitin B 7-O-acetyltransferse L7AT-like n=1 Tax=Apium graveolens TaxID=4045 RepID=UPI003D7B5F65